MIFFVHVCPETRDGHPQENALSDHFNWGPIDNRPLMATGSWGTLVVDWFPMEGTTFTRWPMGAHH
jgi:hypothetical protein